jgi:alkylation response protein AidB-like acyl-CoA dehydrogenase
MRATPASVTRHGTSDLLSAVEALRQVATAHAAESERLRTLAPAVVAALRDSGLFGFCAPEAVGGGGHGPSVQLEVFEAMARIDTSAGWGLMISAMLSAIAGAYLPEEGAHEVFAGGIPTCAGLLLPSGTLRAVPGGYTVDGRWAFGSGIRHADWIVTGAVVAGAPAESAGGPDMRTIVVPARDVAIEDTWHAAGLRGSGSEHYRMAQVFVPERRCFAFPRAPGLRGGPAFDLPVIALLAAAHAGFALGAARAALDALAEIAPARLKPWPGVVLASHAGFQMDLGRADARLRAARAFAREAIEALERRSQERQPLAVSHWRDARLAVTLATELAAEVSRFAFHAGGASALYETSPLQRLFRDLHAAAQHIAATDDAYEFAGRVLLGMPSPHPLMAPRMQRPHV